MTCFADIAGAMQRILVHFQLPADPAQIAAAPGSPVLARYSKAPDQDYGPDIRNSYLAGARREHRAELASGMLLAGTGGRNRTRRCARPGHRRR